MTSLEILVIAGPYISVPPTRYGGTERIVDLLCQGLKEKGHIVRLLAAADSRNYGGGLYVHRPASRKMISRLVRKFVFQIRSLLASRNQQIIVNVGRLDYLIGLGRFRRLPLIAWFHNPVCQSEVDWILKSHRSTVSVVGVSESQLAGIKIPQHRRVIYNAVDTKFLSFCAQPADPPYVAFVGRLTHNKGAHLAIMAARKAGVALRIGGNISKEPGAEQYFRQEIQPHLGQNCEWIGEVDDSQKRTLLQKATALLFPIQWQEPFGIVMAESLACGTPVIAWRMASTPEIVLNGRTGFLCESVEEMARAISKIGTINRQACRDEAEKRFSQPVLVENCLGLINELVAGER
jgi:glycosyltransferase involved in cell wall biosynthesis